jgi:hypothetical protein
MSSLIVDYTSRRKAADQRRFNVKGKRNLEPTKSGTIQPGESRKEEKGVGVTGNFLSSCFPN